MNRGRLNVFVADDGEVRLDFPVDATPGEPCVMSPRRAEVLARLFMAASIEGRRRTRQRAFAVSLELLVQIAQREDLADCEIEISAMGHEIRAVTLGHEAVETLAAEGLIVVGVGSGLVRLELEDPATVASRRC
jgi:hypothetical protein